MCEEDSDDSEAVAKLLEINDSIHRTVERYKLIKKGDIDAASRIPKGTLGTSTGVGKNAANELSLIDFDPEPSMENGSKGMATGTEATTVEDDLLGLSVEDNPSAQSGFISLGFGANSGVPGPPLLSSTMQEKFSTPFATTSPPQQPPQPPQHPRADYNPFSAFTSAQPSSKPASPLPLLQQRQPQQQRPQPKTSGAPIVQADPFAALVNPSSRSSSPFNRQTATRPVAPSSSLLDLADSSSQAGAPSRNGVATEDEWNFASSLPETTLPASRRLEVHSSLIKIDFFANRPAGQQSIQIMAQFSNNTARAIHGLHFQVAVEKVWLVLSKLIFRC